MAPLSHEVGVVASASTDWSLPSIVPVISLVFAMQGISAALLVRSKKRTEMDDIDGSFVLLFEKKRENSWSLCLLVQMD